MTDIILDGADTGDEEKDKYVKFQYYIKRLWACDEAGKITKDKYQFHGNCFFWGVDVAEVDKSKALTCSWSL